MSGGPACKCAERFVPLAYVPGSMGNFPVASYTGLDGMFHPRLWRVIQRQGNASAFAGYRWTPSDYSAVRCVRCGAVWRTKADYVADLPDIKENEENIFVGHVGHVQAMAARGRMPYRQHPQDG